MDSAVWWAFLMSFAPGFESRVSVPILYYSFQDLGYAFWFYFFIVILLNSLVVLVVFLFLEFLHHHLMEWKIYHKTFGKFIEKKKKTAEKVQHRMHNLGYITLALFVAFPFTGTGAYTATIVAWILGLSKKKSFVAISVGILLASLSVFVFWHFGHNLGLWAFTKEEASLLFQRVF
jgi:uncharacterized membrane protein